jgi:uncharacterized protein
MLAALENLLILQDRDRRITQLRAELASLPPQRTLALTRANQAKSNAESARHRVMELETARKKLELDVQSKKEQIERYTLQQYQTKKNEEYRALAHEIDSARDAIRKIEDEELELMEQIELAQRQAATSATSASQSQSATTETLALLDARQANLQSELEKIEANRGELAAAVPHDILTRYEGLRRTKGDKVIVGIDHGVCGGCHMRLPAQLLVSCQAEQEPVSCSNCGRLLYYTRDMSLATAE